MLHIICYIDRTEIKMDQNLRIFFTYILVVCVVLSNYSPTPSPPITPKASLIP
jgi:hypothetical protein